MYTGPVFVPVGRRRRPATEAGGLEGSNERVSADSHEELPVLQASDREEDNERSVRRFGYNPDSDVSDEEEHYGRSERRFGYNQTTATSGRSIRRLWEMTCLPGSII